MGQPGVPPGLEDLMFEIAMAAIMAQPTDVRRFTLEFLGGSDSTGVNSSTKKTYEEYQLQTHEVAMSHSLGGGGGGGVGGGSARPSMVSTRGVNFDSSSVSRFSMSNRSDIDDPTSTSMSGQQGSVYQTQQQSIRSSRSARDNSNTDDDADRTKLKNLAKRRKSVAAERYDPEADNSEVINKVVHPKSDAQRKRLTENVRSILLFRALEVKQLKEVIDAMFQRKVSTGDKVICEGDDGDNVYVIESGTYDILVKNKKVGSYNNTGSFGELALMYNQPRSATIVATSPGLLWALDRVTFRRIVLKSAFNQRQTKIALLESVPLLQSLSQQERLNVADALNSRLYKNGDRIIRQGDEADCMYFVEDGEVVIKVKPSSKDDGEKEVSRIRKGGYFGELALVTHKPRAASAYAVGSVKCAVMDVAAFERLLGPCMEIMKRNIGTYNQQLQQILGTK